MQWIVLTDAKKNKVVVPYSNDATACLQMAKVGEVLYGVLDKPRSQQQHKLYWAALEHAVASSQKWINSKELHRWIKQHTGTHSLADLGHAEFQQFFHAAMLLLTETVGYNPIHEITGEPE